MINLVSIMYQVACCIETQRTTFTAPSPFVDVRVNIIVVSWK